MIYKHALVALVLFALSTGSALADPITINPTAVGSSVSAELECYGIDCSIDVSLSESLEDEEFSLDVGESVDIDFFDFQVWALFAVGDVAIDAVLALATPDISVSNSGNGIFGSFFGHIVAGALVWEGEPEIIDLNDGTFLMVSFQNVIGLTLGDSTNTVHATFSRFGNSVSVPEPASVGLLGLGLLAMGFLGRRRSAAASR